MHNFFDCEFPFSSGYCVNYLEDPFFLAAIVILWVTIFLLFVISQLVKSNANKTEEIDRIRECIRFSQGGIYKKIDEIRSLHQFIKNHPLIIGETTWVNESIASQGEYLLEIMSSADIEPRNYFR